MFHFIYIIGIIKAYVAVNIFITYFLYQLKDDTIFFILGLMLISSSVIIEFFTPLNCIIVTLVTIIFFMLLMQWIINKSKYLVNNFKTETKMKKELIFMFACIVSAMTTLVSCSSDESENAYTQEQPQNTRTAKTEMSMEEIQERLNELGDKYGVPVILSENTDPADITDEFFDFVEQGLKQKASLSDVDVNLNSQNSRIVSSY